MGFLDVEIQAAIAMGKRKGPYIKYHPKNLAIYSVDCEHALAFCTRLELQIDHLQLFVLSPPEASCSSSIRTAQAVVEEAHDLVSPALRKLAKSSEGHSERSFKKTIDEQGLALEVPLTEMSFDKHSFQVLLLSDWIDLVVMLPKIGQDFTLILHWIFWGAYCVCTSVSKSFEIVAHPRKSGNWHTLVAAKDNSQACEQLQLFWDRFKVLRGGHQIFDLEKSAGVDLSRTCPFMLHGDEGRSKKRVGVMRTSAHSVLGKGVATKKKRKFDEAIGTGNDQQMNYVGATHVTRFLMSVLPKFYYGKNEACFHALIEFLSKDLRKLTLDGVLGHDGFRYRIAFISVKGDWPYLHKIAGLTRSFYNQPKQQDAKNACGGICHWCLAGRPGIPFEDPSFQSEWQETIGVEAPWRVPPCILQYVFHDPSFPEGFFHPDPWHSWHLGEGRNWVCNLIKLLLDVTPGQNVEARLHFLFEEYQAFCRRARTQCYCTKFSENLFGITANDFPHGGWTKGNFTTSLIKWLASYLNSQKNNFEQGSLLEKAET